MVRGMDRLRHAASSAVCDFEAMMCVSTCQWGVESLATDVGSLAGACPHEKLKGAIDSCPITNTNTIAISTH
jgi:hypothetical protein